MKIKKQLFLIVLVFSFFIFIQPCYADEEIIYHKYYYDLSEDHFAYQAINSLYDIGATNHRQDNKFQADDLISRGEFIHMLITAMDFPILPDPYLEAGLIGFSDVKIDYPYYQEINIAYRLAIIDGMSDELFAPGDPLRRDALIKTIIRASGILRAEWTMKWMELYEILSPFSDFASYKNFDNWSPHYLAYAVTNNLIQGYPDKSLRPEKYTTRAEAALFIDRFLDYREDTENKYNLANIVCYDSSIQEEEDKLIFSDDNELQSAETEANDIIISHDNENDLDTSDNFEIKQNITDIEEIFETDTTEPTEKCLSLNYLDKITMDGTMYNSLEPGLTFYTATSIRTRVGVVATDINFIPHGTHMYIENYGYAVAADTGSAIKGDKIDLYSVTVREADLFGRQNVLVYLLPQKIKLSK